MRKMRICVTLPHEKNGHLAKGNLGHQIASLGTAGSGLGTIGAGNFAEKDTAILTVSDEQYVQIVSMLQNVKGASIKIVEN